MTEYKCRRANVDEMDRMDGMDKMDAMKGRRGKGVCEVVARGIRLTLMRVGRTITEARSRTIAEAVCVARSVGV